jgi:hypothetical protein
MRDVLLKVKIQNKLCLKNIFGRSQWPRGLRHEPSSPARTLGFGLVIEFIEHLRVVTISNDSDVANSHTLQFTTAHTTAPQSAVSSRVVAW